MAGYSRSPDAATLLMPDDWDETALPGGTCEALSWSVRSRARDMTQLIADVL
jgi:hypothetical protein